MNSSHPCEGSNERGSAFTQLTLTSMIAAFADRPAANAPGLNRYVIQLSRAGVVIHQYETLACDSLAAATDAAVLADGAKVRVWTSAAFSELCRVDREQRREVERMRAEGARW